MRITEVNDDRSKREFLEVPSFIYAEDPVWVRPLDQEIEAIFDPEMNNYHSHGRIARWLLKDDSDQLTRRVSDFINDTNPWLPAHPNCSMAFFSSINNPCTTNQN